MSVAHASWSHSDTLSQSQFGFSWWFTFLWLESILWWLILTWDWDPVANLLAAATVLSGSKTELVILNHCSRSDLSFSIVLWILDLQECHGGVIGTSASFYVLELSRFLTLLEQAICDWNHGAQTSSGCSNETWCGSKLSHVCSKSVCNKWVQEMTFKCLHCVSSWFYLCVKHTFSQKLTWSSEVWCQNTSAYC